MSLVRIVLVLIGVGFGLWAVNTYIPMANPVKAILNAVVVVILCIWLLQTFGVIDGIRSLRVR